MNMNKLEQLLAGFTMVATLFVMHSIEYIATLGTLNKNETEYNIPAKYDLAKKISQKINNPVELALFYGAKRAAEDYAELTKKILGKYYNNFE